MLTLFCIYSNELCSPLAVQRCFFLDVYLYLHIVSETSYKPLPNCTHQEHVPANVITYNSAISALGYLLGLETHLDGLFCWWMRLFISVAASGKWRKCTVDKTSKLGIIFDNISARDKCCVWLNTWVLQYFWCFLHNDDAASNLN